jgi:signal transduction histidine kinase
VRQLPVTPPASQRPAASAGSPSRTLGSATWPTPGPSAWGLIRGWCGPVGHGDGLLLNGRAPGLRRLFGRLAALFYAGSGLLGLALLPLPAPGANGPAVAAVYATAVVVGIAVWLAPWERWPRSASLAVMPPAFALIALRNAYGGRDLQFYGVFFVVAFVWVGMAHPPRTPTAMVPLAAAAYILPLSVLPGGFEVGLPSAALTIPVCLLVGEGLAWGMSRLEGIELALRRERDRTEQLRELDEMKDRFLSAVSHELRTPITICRGHLEVLDEAAGEDCRCCAGGGTCQARQDLRDIRGMLVEELDIMGRVVEDLTTLARADDAAFLKVESLPLDRFMACVAAKAGTILPGRVLVQSAAPGKTLRADPQRLAQALVNLLQNAARHARGQEPVRLGVRAEAASWRFEVADEGGGLPPGDEQAVFEPFSTGGSSNGGTGLGLWIVQGIAQAHGGECGVVNRPGRGATFWIRIPR